MTFCDEFQWVDKIAKHDASQETETELCSNRDTCMKHLNSNTQYEVYLKLPFSELDASVCVGGHGAM